MLFILGVTAIGLLLSGLAFYPGYMSSDSIDQYTQSLTGHFSDWHPPAMAFLWSAFDKVWAGPQLMLFAQLILFWMGAYLWFRANVQQFGILALLPSCVLLFLPTTLNFLGVIWTDVQLAATWSFAMAATYYQTTVGVRFVRTIKIGLLCLVVYGGLVRHNAGLAAGPIVLYVLCGGGTLRTALRTVAAYAMIGLVFLFLGKGVQLALGATHTTVMRALIAFDLEGISFYDNRPLFPFQVTQTEWERLKACYEEDGSSASPLLYGNCGFAWDKISAPTLTDTSVIRFWISTAAAHPLAYIAHRLAYTRLFLSFLPPRSSPFIWFFGIGKNNLGLTASHNVVSNALQRYVYAFGSTPLFRLYVWLLISLIVLAASIYRQLSPAATDFAQAASLTSLLYLLTYVAVGPGADFRYGYISIILATFGAGTILSGLAQCIRTWSGRSGKIEPLANSS